MRLQNTVPQLCTRLAHALQKKEPEAPSTWLGRLARSLILLTAATLPTHAQLDTSGNGMSDVWERHFNQGNLFDPQNLDHAPHADPDGDGWSNLQEFIAGTDPFSGNPPDGRVSTHVTHLPGQGAADDGAIISWVTLPGKLYTLKASPELTAASWISIDSEYKARVRLQIELAQQDLQARREMMASIVSACNELRLWIQEANHDLLASLVLRSNNAELADFHGQRLGEKSQLVLDLAASLIEAASDGWTNAPPYDKGRYTGIVIFEVASSFITVSKVGKLSKAEVLLDIAKRDIDIPAGPSIKARAAAFGEELATTKMCFVAGTLVLVQVNGSEALLPIEELEPLARSGAKIKAWAKCEHSGVEDWRPIVAFFTTHPAELFDLAIDTTGDGEADETLTGTGEHPFWVEDDSAFIPMRELVLGMRLNTARSTGMASVVGNVSKRGPPGERFTTYNFEVAGFHTYFVGVAGVWVHNNSREPCEKIFSIYKRLRTRGLDLWEAFAETAKKTPGVPSQTYGLAAGEAMDEIYRLAALGENVTIPTHKMVRDIMKGRNIKFQDVEIPEGSFFAMIDSKDAEGIFRKLRLESHHGAPRQFQKWLGINDRSIQDSSPAYLTSLLEHGGSQLGIHQALEDVLGFEIKGNRPSGFTDQQLIQKLRDAYSEIGLNDFGGIAVNWLETQL